MSFQMRVSTEIPVEHYKYLFELGAKKNTTVGALVAELVRRQLAGLSPAVPAARKPSRPPRPFTGADAHRLLELHSKGLNDSEIGRRLDFSPRTIREHRRDMGLERLAAPGRPKQVTA